MRFFRRLRAARDSVNGFVERQWFKIAALIAIVMTVGYVGAATFNLPQPGSALSVFYFSCSSNVCPASVAIDQNGIAATDWTMKTFIAANSDNATNLKGSAGLLHAVQVFGVGSAPAYLKFYNTSSSPTCGSSTVVKEIMIPAASTAANGAGAVSLPIDAYFSTGISYCVTLLLGVTDDTSVPAATYIVNIDYN